jgi:hypothetical protein
MRRIIAILALLVFAGCAQAERYVEIIDVQPLVQLDLISADGEPPWDAILGSMTSFGPVHAMSFYGDFDDLVEIHHRELMRYLGTPGTQLEYHTGCSMFHFAAADTTDMVGRNYDNVATDLLAGWVFPEDGYASITLFPLKLFGFDNEHRFDSANRAHKNMILRAPVMSVEGMNEAGVTIMLASLGRREVDQAPDRKPRFFLHLVREILDHAGSVEQAIAIAGSYNLFDNGRTIMSHHILLAGPGEESVVLEWEDGVMNVVRDGPSRQIVTNSDMFNTSQPSRRQACPRYRRIASTLDDTESLDWKGGLDILASVSQKGGRYEIEGRSMYISTQWSAVFDLHAREVLLCMDREFTTVYRMGFPDHLRRN